MGFFKCCADLVQINDTSWRMLTRCGFRVTGFREKHVLVSGRRHNLTTTELLLPQWERAEKRLVGEERSRLVVPPNYNRYLRMAEILRYG